MTSSVSTGGMFAAYLLMMAMVLLVGVVVYAISAFYLSKVFDKAGVDGRWRAWVPVYNTMIMFKLADLSPWLVLYLVGAGLVLSVIGIGFLISLVFFAVSFVVAHRIGQKLGAEPAMVALWIIPLVWFIVMGSSRNQWTEAIAPAPWAGNSVLEDRTRWEGVPTPNPRVETPPAAA